MTEEHYCKNHASRSCEVRTLWTLYFWLKLYEL